MRRHGHHLLFPAVVLALGAADLRAQDSAQVELQEAVVATPVEGAVPSLRFSSLRISAADRSGPCGRPVPMPRVPAQAETVEMPTIAPRVKTVPMPTVRCGLDRPSPRIP